MALATPPATRPVTATSTPDMLSPKEVASRWGVHVDTVRRLIERRKLKAITIGRLVKIRVSDMNAYYREHMR